MIDPRHSQLLRAILLATGVALVYVAILAVLVPPNGLWSGDQGAKLVQIFSLLSSRFRSAALIDPAQAIDPERALSPLPALYATPIDGSYYSIFSYPYAALTAVPFFFAGYPGLYLIPIAATATTCLLLALIGRRLGIARWWLIVPLAGLATPLGFYALVLWEHALAVCLAVGAALVAITALERAGATAHRRAITLAALAGLLGGLGYWMRAELLWLAPALLAGLIAAGAGRREIPTRAEALESFDAPTASAGFAAAFGPQPSALNLALAAALGFAGPIGLSLTANAIVFGHPLGPQVAANFAPEAAGDLLGRRASIAGALLLGIPGQQLLPALGLLAALAAAALLRLRHWLLLLSALTALLAITLHWGSLQTGLAVTAPLALAGLAAPGARLRPAARLLLVTALVFGVGVLLTAPNDGGAQWGPRYLLVSIALLTPLGVLAAGGERAALLAADPRRASHEGGASTGAPAPAPVLSQETKASGARAGGAPALPDAQRHGPPPASPSPPTRAARRTLAGSLPRAALTLLVAAGLAGMVAGVLLLQGSTRSSLRIVQVVNAQPARAVLSDIWYGPQLLAPLYIERDLLFIDSPERLGEARAILRRAGVTELSYVTARPWERDTALPPELGLDCARVEGFAYGLTLLSCTILEDP